MKKMKGGIKIRGPLGIIPFPLVVRSSRIPHVRIKSYEADEVTPFREPTGKIRSKSSKWEGTCFTCGRKTKRGFCNAVNSWDAQVRTPNMYCESWSEG